jgi:N-carbamoylputrescine amidase
MPRNVTVALLQMRASADPSENLRRTIEWIERAAAQKAQLVCTQELFRSRYFCQSEDHANFALAEPIPGPTTSELGRVAARLRIVVIASLFERRAAGLYHNTAVVIDGSGGEQGKIVGMYRKMHIPDDPLYFEKFYFTPGDLGFLSFQTSFARTGVLVCWDQWFPEAARITALKGAEILFYPTAIGWHPSEKAQWGERQYRSWETIQRAHAVANGLFVAVPNRVGHELPAATQNGAGDGIEFWGGSFICDPSGEILARGSHGKEEIVLATCDLDEVERARTHWPFLRDRRIDAYQGLTQRLLD